MLRRLYICVYININIHKDQYIYVCLYVCLYVLVCTYIVKVCMYIYTYVDGYGYTKIAVAVIVTFMGYI